MSIIMLDGMSTDEGRLGFTRSPLSGAVPLALLTLIFIGYAVPPYLSLDPTRARIQPRKCRDR
jgi:hypothetical protein